MSALVAIPVSAVVKTCSCGEAYDATRWAALPLVGYCGAASGDESQALELRQCSCRSTIALDVPMEARVSRRRFP